MYILDIKIDNISKKEVLKKITELLRSDEIGNQLCTTNPEFILEAQNNQEFKNIINNSWLSVADGYGIKLAAKYLELIRESKNYILNFLIGMKIAYWGFTKNKKLNTLKDIITGSDLVSEISEICTKKNKKVFLLGGFKNTPELTAQVLRKNNPNLQIAYSVFEVKNILNKINEFKPDVLFVALNHPLAQQWINENLPKLPSIKLAIGVGGSFDYISGKIKRAPKNWRYSFEWLFRLIKQPERWKRIWNAWIVFSWKIFTNSINKKQSITDNNYN